MKGSKVKAKGFTLFELMIAMVFISMVAVIVVSSYSQPNAMSFGLNGMTETRCIRGYEFVVGANGSTQQVLNDQGGGVKC